MMQVSTLVKICWTFPLNKITLPTVSGDVSPTLSYTTLEMGSRVPLLPKKLASSLATVLYTLPTGIAALAAMLTYFALLEQSAFFGLQTQSYRKGKHIYKAPLSS
jgi:hypothetical protein